MTSRITRAADGARQKIRDALHETARRFAAEGRAYNGLDHTVYVLYAIECFLHALARSERGKDFVLKGGNLFRVWDGMTGFRPTGDLDLQCSGHEEMDIIDIRQEVAAIVDTPEFSESTGLVFPLAEFKVERIRHGYFKTYRLNGRAILGDPGDQGSKSADIPFCLEVVYGPTPQGAVTLSTWKSIIPNGGTFELPAGRPEWMAAEKFHSLVTRGAANSRLKDYRDLHALLQIADFDDQRLHICIREVFGQRDQSHLVPDTPKGVAGLSPAFASPHNEALWQGRRWPEWEGREWNEASDPTLAETIVGIIIALERKGVLTENPGTQLALALGEVVAASAELSAGQQTPAAAARYATALKTMARYAERADSADVAMVWAGLARRHGLAGAQPAQVLAQVLKVAETLGLMAAIDRGWNRGRGGGIEALGQLQRLLAAKTVRETGIDRSASQEGGGPSGTGPARRGRRGGTAYKTADDVILESLEMLRASRPGTHVWFGGLAKLLAAGDQGTIPSGTNLTIEMPEDRRAPYIWIQIAKKQGVESNLEKAIAAAQSILSPAAASYMPR